MASNDGTKRRILEATGNISAEPGFEPRDSDTPHDVRLKDLGRTVFHGVTAVQHLPRQARPTMQEFLLPTAAWREVADESIGPQREQLVGELREHGDARDEDSLQQLTNHFFGVIPTAPGRASLDFDSPVPPAVVGGSK